MSDALLREEILMEIDIGYAAPLLAVCVVAALACVALIVWMSR